ncbi:hypothetical protein FIP36_16905 [Salmonella enterica]|nr:hypothetical protein [Salmonella enterica]
MAKYLTPNELGEIVCGLLVKPSLFGELKTPELHKAFIEELGQLVTKHCGGQIESVIMPYTGDADGHYVEPVEYMTAPESIPYLVVKPDNDMPSLINNVWRFMAPDGWLDEIKKLKEESPCDLPTHTECSEVRYALQRLLIPSNLSRFNLKEQVVRMQDCRYDDEDLKPGDDKVYTVTAALGGNAQLAVQDHKGKYVFGATFTIENDVPALHINPGDTDAASLHVHAAHGGLILAPGSLNHEFEISPVDRFTYDRPGLLLKSV